MFTRLCKTSLVASLAIFFAIVAFTNITDYSTNKDFVRHVLAMDTIFSDSTLKWRAITDERIATASYWLIIGWEIMIAVMLTFATFRLVASCRDRARFSELKSLAIRGLILGLLLYGLGITTIGGEWFAMWQSKDWNGLDSAARFTMLDGLILLVMLAPEQ